MPIGLPVEIGMRASCFSGGDIDWERNWKNDDWGRGRGGVEEEDRRR